MDKAWVFYTHDTGSIPVEGAILRITGVNIIGFEQHNMNANNTRTEFETKLCKQCHNELTTTHSKMFCSRSCAARFNNKGVRRHGKPNQPCLNCGKTTNKSTNKYCSVECHHEYNYSQYIEQWKQGEITGLNCNGMVTQPIKRYLREKYHNACTLCGWSKINPYSNKVPLVADHIDGNWKNNTEDNLRLLCGCCDSLTNTFCGLNKGNGRSQRYKQHVV